MARKKKPLVVMTRAGGHSMVGGRANYQVSHGPFNSHLIQQQAMKADLQS